MTVSCHRCCGSRSTPLVRRPVAAHGAGSVAWAARDVSVISAATEEWHASHVAEVVVDVGLSGTTDVLGTLHLNSGEVLSTDKGELQQESVSKDALYWTLLMTHGKLTSHGSSGVFLKVDKGKCDAL
jgi:hypothetical protein